MLASCDSSESIRELLLILRDHYELEGDERGILDSAIAIKNPSRASEKMRAFIAEFKKTGKIREIEKIKPRVQIYRDLRGLKGFGIPAIRDMIARGIKTPADITRAKIKLTRLQEVGLKYYDDLIKKLSRDEVAKYAREFTQIITSIDSGARVEIAGSYRRELAECGDIDLLVCCESCPRTLREFVNLLMKNKSYRCVILMQGDAKVSFIFAGARGVMRQCDVVCTNAHEYPAALLYFTGSAEYNIRMRAIARAKGMLLNQKGLFTIRGKEVPVKSEADIFSILGVPYAEPRARTL